MFHFLCVTNAMSSFQKSIMKSIILKNNSSIIFNMIITKVYCNMDNKKSNKVNVEDGFKF
jgi:hypothetical protein